MEIELSVSESEDFAEFPEHESVEDTPSEESVEEQPHTSIEKRIEVHYKKIKKIVATADKSTQTISRSTWRRKKKRAQLKQQNASRTNKTSCPSSRHK